MNPLIYKLLFLLSRYLGVIIDNKLKGSEHAEYIIKAVSKKINFLS